MSDSQGAHLLLNRRNFLGLTAASALFALAGCSSNSAAGAAGGTAFRAPSYVAPEASDALLVSSVPGVPPMAVKPVTDWISGFHGVPGKGGAVTVQEIIWSSAGSPLDSNDRWKALNKELGVEWKPTLVPSGSYDQKTATMLASGKVPDLAFILDSTPTVAQAIQDGAFADLSDDLAGDGILKYPNLARIDRAAWAASAKNGRIYGVPNSTGLTTAFPVIRTDLMARVGYDAVPADRAEFGRMLTELAKLGTVDGREVHVHNTLNQGGMPLFKSMFGLGGEYGLDGDKIVPQYMDAAYPDFIAYVADLWQKKVFHPDTFGTGIDNRKFGIGQEALSVASFSGFYWAGAGQVNLLLANVPGASVTHFVMPGADGKKAVFGQPAGYWGIVALSAAAAKDPARKQELLRIADWFCSPYNSTQQRLVAYGVEGVDFTTDAIGNLASTNRPGHESDGSATNLGISGYPVNIMPQDTVPLAQNVMSTLEGMVKQSVPSPVAGLISKAQIRSSAALAEIVKNFENGMITGRKPISAVAEFRKTWLAQGGQKVLDEYQKLYDEKRKAGK